MAARKVVLILNFLTVCVGLGGIIAGGIGSSWWVFETNTGKLEVGLWRACTKVTAFSNTVSTCNNREDIFEFKIFKKLDIILLLFIGGAFFTLISFITSSCMFCCQKNKCEWECGSVLMSITTFLAASAILGGLIYAEIEIESKLSNEFKFAYRGLSIIRGWSVILGWVGGIMCFLSFIMSVVLSCFNVEEEYSLHVMSYVGATPSRTPGYQMDTRGNINFQHTAPVNDAGHQHQYPAHNTGSVQGYPAHNTGSVQGYPAHNTGSVQGYPKPGYNAF